MFYLSSSEEVEVVSRGCWAEQPQPCSSSSFRECHFSYSPEYWSQSGAPRPKASSRRRFWGQSFSPDSLRLRLPAAYGPGLLRAGPAGEERRTPHYSVPVSPQCPQEIGLPTLPVLQGAAVSSEHFSQLIPPVKHSGAERLAAPSGVPRAAGLVVSCQSSASGHRASSSRHTRGQFRETGSLSRGFMRFALGAKHTNIVLPLETVTASVVGLLSLLRVFEASAC